MSKEIFSRIFDLKTPPAIGKTYIVPCFDAGELLRFDCPVLSIPHEDSDIGGERRKHVHVDPRFISDEQLVRLCFTEEQVEEMNKGLATLALLCEPNWWTETFLSGTAFTFSEKPMECLRNFPAGLQPRISLPGVARLASRLQKENFSLNPACKVCPHKGTRLDNVPIVNGTIICPAHGLRFSADGKPVHCHQSPGG